MVTKQIRGDGVLYIGFFSERGLIIGQICMHIYPNSKLIGCIEVVLHLLQVYGRYHSHRRHMKHNIGIRNYFADLKSHRPFHQSYHSSFRPPALKLFIELKFWTWQNKVIQDGKPCYTWVDNNFSRIFESQSCIFCRSISPGVFRYTSSLSLFYYLCSCSSAV